MIDSEKSCGAVIYTKLDGMRLYLIEQMQKGHRYLICISSWTQTMTNALWIRVKKHGKKSRQMQTFSTMEPLTMVRLYRLVMLFTYVSKSDDWD